MEKKRKRKWRTKYGYNLFGCSEKLKRSHHKKNSSRNRTLPARLCHNKCIEPLVFTHTFSNELRMCFSNVYIIKRE